MRVSEGIERARQPRGPDPMRMAAWLLALPVHVVTAALVVVGVWIVVVGDGWGRLVAALPLLTAVALRPRLPKRAKPGLMDATAFPESAALIAEVARAVGARPPVSALVNTDFNAHVGPSRRGGRELVLGAPLWTTLAPQARVALLSHELGHIANGDVLSGTWVSWARYSLLSWLDILTPGTAIDPRAAGYYRLGALALLPARLAVRGYLWLFHRVAQSSNRRQETFADLVSVRVAGTDGAVDLLETLLADVSVEVTLNRSAITRADTRAELNAFRTTYDAPARAAARRHGATDERRADDSHPPTVTRLALVESVDRAAAQVVLDGARNARLDRELHRTIDSALREGSYRYLGH